MFATWKLRPFFLFFCTLIIKDLDFGEWISGWMKGDLEIDSIKYLIQKLLFGLTITLWPCQPLAPNKQMGY